MSQFTRSFRGGPCLKRHPVVDIIRFFLKARRSDLDRWVRESDLGSSYKGYTGYREELGGKDDIGGPNQANPEALAFILWCQKSISE